MESHTHHTNTNTDHSVVQDLQGSGSVTLQEAISSYTSDSSHASHAAHAGDDGKIQDHTQLLDLFPNPSDSNTNVALNGGSWFDPNTWSKGVVPTTGEDVYIPQGVSVVYDGVSEARLNDVGVDGELHFAVNVDTKMVVDTFVTGPRSVLTVGVEGNPVQPGVDAVIVIHRDNGPVTSTENLLDDPDLLGHGVVTHGVVRIAGQDKTDHLKASKHPEAGDNFLIFDEMPHGWQAGDKIVVAAASNEMNQHYQIVEYHDEVVTVQSIDNLGSGTFRVNLNQTCLAI